MFSAGCHYDILNQFTNNIIAFLQKCEYIVLLLSVLMFCNVNGNELYITLNSWAGLVTEEVLSLPPPSPALDQSEAELRDSDQ